MMALFLVLWLVGSDQETKLAVQRYFRGEITKQGSTGTQKYSKQQPFQNQDHDRASRNLVEQVNMKRELERLREQLNNSSESGDDLIRYQFLADGVRITVIDSSAKPFFDPGTAKLTNYGTLGAQDHRVVPRPLSLPARGRGPHAEGRGDRQRRQHARRRPAEPELGHFHHPRHRRARHAAGFRACSPTASGA